MVALLLLAGPVYAEVSVIDDFGRTVSLPKAAKRIISLAPHNTENLFSAGAGDKLVGVVDHSDYPDAANQILSVGTHVEFNLEAILSLNPDIVVAWRGGNNADALDQIEQLGVPVYYSEPRTFSAILDNIRDFAQLAGSENQLDSDVIDIEDRIEQVKASYKDEQPISVFYQVWTDPLMTLNGEHFISRVLETCGATNLFAELPIIAPRVNIEAVIQANPDVIITGMVNDKAPDMSLWTKWQMVSAVKNNHYIFVDSDVMHRHTLRMLNGIEPVCQQIDRVRSKVKN